MPLLHALLLGIVQGLTEFLPVSSSGHLALIPWVFGWDDFNGNAAVENAFDVALHLGTLVGAFVYLRNDAARYVGAGIRWLHIGGKPEGDARTAFLIAFTVIPTALLGLILMTLGDDLGDRTWLLATALICFGLLLWIADRQRGDREMADLSFRQAAWLGIAQGLAFQPGVSRSGVVLTVARSMRLERDEATRLSFLMGMPVIAGAGVVSALDLSVPSGWWPPFVVGTLASAVSGWLAVHVLLRLVVRTGLAGFAAYRVVLGLGVLVLLATGLR